MSKTRKPNKQEPPVEVYCPYCGSLCELVDDTEVYKRSFGRKMWLCRPCVAYVSTHKGSPTFKPVGTPAKKNLRELRHRCHTLFDPLWVRVAARDGKSVSEARQAGYHWLSEQLGGEGSCHIGFADEATCERIIQLCLSIGKKNDETKDVG